MWYDAVKIELQDEYEIQVAEISIVHISYA